MSWPRVEREPVTLPSVPGVDDALWDTLVELCEVRPGEWTLIGGQMVLLHALEHDTAPPRVSTDLDILVNARIVSGTIAAFVVAIESLGFELAGMGPDGIAHRYQRGTVTVDVLAPDGLGPRTDLTTTVPGRTLQVPGGTQALERTELVPVETTTRRGHVPRPSLLGAIVSKAVAVRVDDVPEAQRQDLAFLLSLVADPFELRAHIGRTDRRRLRARAELLNDEHPAWRQLAPETRDRGRATLRILSS
jgi:hypothetical protein